MSDHFVLRRSEACVRKPNTGVCGRGGAPWARPLAPERCLLLLLLPRAGAGDGSAGEQHQLQCAPVGPTRCKVAGESREGGVGVPCSPPGHSISKALSLYSLRYADDTTLMAETEEEQRAF